MILVDDPLPVELSGLNAGCPLSEAAPVVSVLVVGGHGRHQQADHGQNAAQHYIF